jgi:hypothetical protein
MRARGYTRIATRPREHAPGEGPGMPLAHELLVVNRGCYTRQLHQQSPTPSLFLLLLHLPALTRRAGLALGRARLAGKPPRRKRLDPGFLVSVPACPAAPPHQRHQLEGPHQARRAKPDPQARREATNKRHNRTGGLQHLSQHGNGRSVL